jgi:hypothetical protein
MQAGRLRSRGKQRRMMSSLRLPGAVAMISLGDQNSCARMSQNTGRSGKEHRTLNIEHRMGKKWRQGIGV